MWCNLGVELYRNDPLLFWNWCDSMQKPNTIIDFSTPETDRSREISNLGSISLDSLGKSDLGTRTILLFRYPQRRTLDPK